MSHEPGILVTGSSGFIGGRLVDAFVDRYHVFAALRQGKSTLLDTKDASSVSYEDINCCQIEISSNYPAPHLRQLIVLVQHYLSAESFFNGYYFLFNLSS